MPQIFKLMLTKSIFFCFDKKTNGVIVPLKLFSYIANEFSRLSYKLKYHKKNKDIISEIGSKDRIHDGLEDGGGIAQAERYDQILVVAIVYSKSSFRNVRRINPYLVISFPEIQLGKISGTMQLVQHIFYYRNRKAVFDSHCVECTIINTESPNAIFFLN